MPAPVATASAAALPHLHDTPRSRYAERGAELCVRAYARNLLYRCPRRLLSTLSGVRNLRYGSMTPEMAQDHPDYVEYASVRLGADGAAEMDRNRKLVHIPRVEVVRLELVHGSAAERPVLSLVLGLVLLAVALLGPAMLLLALLGRGTVEVKFVTSIAFIVPSAWLLDLVLRRRWFLNVYTSKGSRKLIFEKSSDPVAMQQFVVSAKERFGYS